jgi:hypothetical protein
VIGVAVCVSTPARWLLSLGIAATLAANVAHGLGHATCQIGQVCSWYPMSQNIHS